MEAASQAADQVVRLTLEGVEYAIRCTQPRWRRRLESWPQKNTPVKVLSALRPCSRVDEN